MDEESSEAVKVDGVWRRQNRGVVKPHRVGEEEYDHCVIDSQAHPSEEELPLQLSILHILLVKLRVSGKNWKLQLTKAPLPSSCLSTYSNKILSECFFSVNEMNRIGRAVYTILYKVKKNESKIDVDENMF